MDFFELFTLLPFTSMPVPAVLLRLRQIVHHMSLEVEVVAQVDHKQYSLADSPILVLDLDLVPGFDRRQDSTVIAVFQGRASFAIDKLGRKADPTSAVVVAMMLEPVDRMGMVIDRVADAVGEVLPVMSMETGLVADVVEEVLLVMDIGIVEAVAVAGIVAAAEVADDRIRASSEVVVEDDWDHKLVVVGRIGLEEVESCRMKDFVAGNMKVDFVVDYIDFGEAGPAGRNGSEVQNLADCIDWAQGSSADRTDSKVDVVAGHIVGLVKQVVADTKDAMILRSSRWADCGTGQRLTY